MPDKNIWIFSSCELAEGCCWMTHVDSLLNQNNEQKETIQTHFKQASIMHWY